ncbi:MAG: tetratricopeptide repeat protein, partial [Lentisphaerae bacterium]
LYFMLHRDPLNVKATLAYASFFVRNQQYDKALNIYTRAIRAGVDDPAVWMNLGNLFYLQELPRQALLFYERAEQHDIPDPKFRALLFYNKGKAYHSILEFTKGEELIQEAFRLNPALSRYITDTTLVMDAYPMAKDLHYPDWSFVIRQCLADTFSDPRVILLILFILIGVVLYIIRWPAYKAKQCERCGDAYCPRCTSKVASFPYCNACMHLFILRDGISPAARKQKLHQIEIFNRKTALVRNLVRLLIPGSGPFYINERFNGIWIMLIIAAGLSIISEISHVAPWWVPTHDLPGPVLLAVLTILVVYLLNGVYVLIRKA